MSSGQFNREKGNDGNPRRGRSGASGSDTHAHTSSFNSISSPIFGDDVPENITNEQINEMFEASKSHNIEDNEDDEQPTKPK
ncbi:hypothetical protein OROHE_003818 [Orobanche hederae]